MKNALIGRIVRNHEIVLVSLTCIHMTHHDEEATSLQHEVGIDIDERIVAHLCLNITILLYCILAERCEILRCIILREIVDRSTEMTMQHSCYFEIEIEITPHIEIRNRYYTFHRTLLVCYLVLLVKSLEYEILRQLCRKDANILICLSNIQLMFYW